jgi:hypothetical protein
VEQDLTISGSTFPGSPVTAIAGGGGGGANANPSPGVTGRNRRFRRRWRWWSIWFIHLIAGTSGYS